MAYLYPEGPQNSAQFSLGPQNLVGSDSKADLRLDGNSIKSRHCYILELPDGRFRIDQIADGARILVNGHDVNKSILHDGDRVQIGSHAFVFFQRSNEFVNDADIDFDDVSVEVSLRRTVTPNAVKIQQSKSADPNELKKLRAAYRLSRSLGQNKSLDELLAIILDIAIETFSPERSAIFLLKPDSEDISAQHFRSAKPEATRMRVSRSVLNKAIRGREAILSVDALTDERLNSSQSVRLNNVHSIAAVPMLHHEKCLGVLYLDSSLSSGLFQKQDLELITTFAQQAALVVHNANLVDNLQKSNRELEIATESALAANASLIRKTEELEKLVVKDPLTGLFNHAYLQDQVGQEIARGQRQAQPFAVILLNIDGFRLINDQHGHEVGNQLLRKLSEILQKATRQADLGAHISEEIITRYGGDIFAILLPGTDKRGASAAAERLRLLVAAYDFSQHDLPKPGVSLGVAAFPVDASKRSSLITAAETALFAAKQVGGGQCIAFSNALNVLNDKHDDSELGRILGLDRVIKQSLIKYLYQPIVDAKTKQIFAYEALCRPQDSAFHGPEELINTAERKGRIPELGQLMRKVALSAFATLPDPRLMFINLHPLELNDSLLKWAQLCKHPKRIVLEVTESAAVQDHERVRTLLQQCRELGFRVAVDDLGSGYSGLNSLALLEPDFVKLDMRMVRNIDHNPRAARLIRHILDFAQDEGMLVIAEGVETEQERLIVTELGCDLIQGYFFSRPKPAFCELVTETQSAT